VVVGDLLAVGRVVHLGHELRHHHRVTLVGHVEEAGSVEGRVVGSGAAGGEVVGRLPEAEQVRVPAVVEQGGPLVGEIVFEGNGRHDPPGVGPARADVGGVDDQHAVGRGYRRQVGPAPVLTDGAAVDGIGPRGQLLRVGGVGQVD